MIVVGKVTQELRAIYGKTEAEYRAFACGYVAGQAEKIYLGVCGAAMFRPGREHLPWYFAEVSKIAKTYGLHTSLVQHKDSDTAEIWIHRKGLMMSDWMAKGLNTPEYHTIRARLCGIPEADIDTQYHLRDGHNEPCD